MLSTSTSTAAAVEATAAPTTAAATAPADLKSDAKAAPDNNAKGAAKYQAMLVARSDYSKEEAARTLFKEAYDFCFDALLEGRANAESHFIMGEWSSEQATYHPYSHFITAAIKHHLKALNLGLNQSAIKLVRLYSKQLKQSPCSYKEMMYACEASIRFNPGETVALLSEFAKSMEGKDNKNAINCYLFAATNGDSASLDAAIAMADRWANSAKPEEVADIDRAYETCLALQIRHNPAYVLKLANRFNARQDYKKAQSYYAHPWLKENGSAIFALGNLHARQDEKPQSLACFEKVVSGECKPAATQDEVRDAETKLITHYRENHTDASNIKKLLDIVKKYMGAKRYTDAYPICLFVAEKSTVEASEATNLLLELARFLKTEQVNTKKQFDSMKTQVDRTKHQYVRRVFVPNSSGDHYDSGGYYYQTMDQAVIDRDEKQLADAKSSVGKQAELYAKMHLDAYRDYVRLAKPPTDLEACYQVALEHEQKGEKAEAIRLFEMAAKDSKYQNAVQAMTKIAMLLPKDQDAKAVGADKGDKGHRLSDKAFSLLADALKLGDYTHTALDFLKAHFKENKDTVTAAKLIPLGDSLAKIQHEAKDIYELAIPYDLKAYNALAILAMDDRFGNWRRELAAPNALKAIANGTVDEKLIPALEKLVDEQLGQFSSSGPYNASAYEIIVKCYQTVLQHRSNDSKAPTSFMLAEIAKQEFLLHESKNDIAGASPALEAHLAAAKKENVEPDPTVCMQLAKVCSKDAKRADEAQSLYEQAEALFKKTLAADKVTFRVLDGAISGLNELYYSAPPRIKNIKAADYLLLARGHSRINHTSEQLMKYYKSAADLNDPTGLVNYSICLYNFENAQRYDRDSKVKTFGYILRAYLQDGKMDKGKVDALCVSEMPEDHRKEYEFIAEFEKVGADRIRWLNWIVSGSVPDYEYRYYYLPHRRVEDVHNLQPFRDATDSKDAAAAIPLYAKAHTVAKTILLKRFITRKLVAMEVDSKLDEKAKPQLHQTLAKCLEEEASLIANYSYADAKKAWQNAIEYLKKDQTRDSKAEIARIEGVVLEREFDLIKQQCKDQSAKEKMSAYQGLADKYALAQLEIAKLMLVTDVKDVPKTAAAAGSGGAAQSPQAQKAMQCFPLFVKALNLAVKEGNPIAVNLALDSMIPLRKEYPSVGRSDDALLARAIAMVDVDAKASTNRLYDRYAFLSLPNVPEDVREKIESTLAECYTSLNLNAKAFVDGLAVVQSAKKIAWVMKHQFAMAAPEDKLLCALQVAIVHPASYNDEMRSVVASEKGADFLGRVIANLPQNELTDNLDKDILKSIYRLLQQNAKKKVVKPSQLIKEGNSVVVEVVNKVRDAIKRVGGDIAVVRLESEIEREFVAEAQQGLVTPSLTRNNAAFTYATTPGDHKSSAANAKHTELGVVGGHHSVGAAKPGTATTGSAKPAAAASTTLKK